MGVDLGLAGCFQYSSMLISPFIGRPSVMLGKTRSPFRCSMTIMGTRFFTCCVAVTKNATVFVTMSMCIHTLSYIRILLCASCLLADLLMISCALPLPAGMLSLGDILQVLHGLVHRHGNSIQTTRGFPVLNAEILNQSPRPLHLCPAISRSKKG